MAKFNFFNLEKHFAFYGAYHRNPINIGIHMIFVWPIFFSAIFILNSIPFPFNLPHVEFSPFGINIILILNIGFLVTLIYSAIYLGFDWKAGSLAAFLCFLCWIASSYFASRNEFSLAWKVVLVAQLVCWTGQFIGHGVFEKRAPAFLDNLSQAFLMAPFFVLLEALQILFRCEPYPGFEVRVQARIEEEIKEWKEKQEELLS